MDANVCTFSLDWDDDRQKLTIQAVRPRAVFCRAALHLRSCANTLDQANPTSLAFDAADTTHWFTFIYVSFSSLLLHNETSSFVTERVHPPQGTFPNESGV